MEIKDLQAQMNQFVADKGWYAADSSKPQTPKNIAISLVLEANEVLEHFQWGEGIKNKEELKGELADVALYLLQLSYLCKIDLEESIQKKLEYNYRRSWE